MFFFTLFLIKTPGMLLRREWGGLLFKSIVDARSWDSRRVLQMEQVFLLLSMS